MPALIAEVVGREDMTRGEIVRSIYVSLASQVQASCSSGSRPRRAATSAPST